MKTVPGRSIRRTRWSLCTVGALALAAGAAAAPDTGATPSAGPIRHTATHSASQVPPEIPPPRLSYSDEFDRAELIEQMLAQCRGIPYNAYELAQTSGEALWLPAPIQLVVVRVRHPYCRELLRTYAPRTGV